MVEPDMRQMTMCRILFACWVTKATDTHLEYVVLNALPRQQW
jgi:hypothetical protein